VVQEVSEIDGTVGSLRTILLGILLLGMAGTSTELLLLKHSEDVTQLIPLILLGMGFAVVVWNAVRRSRSSLLSMQVLMVLFVGAGALGMFFHYRANVDFQLEIEPALSGSNLWWKVLQAKTPPALAPGVMAQLGLIGLAYAYRHPAVARTHADIEENRYGE
jgi:hypothetical protein